MILALNCGSSSVKYQLYAWNAHQVICKGVVERVGNAYSYILHERAGYPMIKKEKPCADHKLAIRFIIEVLTDPEIGVIKSMQEIRAVGHRVVHGGDKFSRSVLIDENVLKSIKEVQELAPLHNPPNIAGIESAQEVMPGTPQIAVFDTAFHQTIPEHAYMYAIPLQWYQDYGIRRYGFHGTSHLYVSKRAQVLLGKPVEATRIITMHIGNGVSISAVKGGICVDTSMGFTPLEGAIMGTRSGDIDPAIVPYVAQKLNITAVAVVEMLNKKSGLLGITGQFTDRRDVTKGAQDGDKLCQLAMEMEAYRLRKYIGAYAAGMGGVDAVVFTAGVGENNWLIRAKALEGLDFMGIKLDREVNERTVGKKEELEINQSDSAVKVYVIPTNEEIVFIEDVVAILENRYDVHTKYRYSFQS
ncbi:MAG: acetate kinase [Candidatus Margulisiibacteriota bacterium]|jgi:acetate kinase